MDTVTSGQRRKAIVQFGEWVIADLLLQTDSSNGVAFCCHEKGASARVAALGAMYTRMIEHAENLGVIGLGTSRQVKHWLVTGYLR
jgi:hypothetical protein